MVKKRLRTKPCWLDEPDSNVEWTEDYVKLIHYGLDKTVAAKLCEIYKTGKLSHEDLDERALDALREFPVDGALSVLTQFLESNLGHVSNKSAYLCGVMKTYRQKKRGGSSSGIGGATPGAGGNVSKGPDEEKIKDTFENQLKELMKISSCPVCFERMTPQVVCCVNGHAICHGCKTTLTKCPTCRSAFSVEGHTFISQLLEALPFPCTNEGCPRTYIDRSQLKEHELFFCSHRIINCRICPWTGKMKDLKDHVNTIHLRYLGNCDTEYELNANILDVSDQLSTSFEEGCYKTLFSEYYEQFFWRPQILNKNKENLTLRYICVPDERAEKSCFVVKVEFEGNGNKALIETQLTKNIKKSILEASLSINTELLEKMRKDNETLKYKFSLKKFEEQ